MNSLGRHFRNQEDTSNPSCDYEGCNFFTSGALYSNLPYPDDVSLGPLTDQQPPASVTPQQSELGQILSMLRDQKLESEKTNERMNMLQAQVNSILMPTTTTGVTVASTTPATTTVSTSNTYSSPPTSAPNVIASAASNLAAALQGGLGHGNNYGYQGLTMNHLRADPAINAGGNAVLAEAIRNVPPLNPIPQAQVNVLGPAVNQHQPSDQVINSVEQLFRATTVNKQLRSYEFASTGQFS